MRLRDDTGAAVRLGFADDPVFVAIPLERDPSRVPGVVDETAVRTWIGELGFATGIVEDLDLNTRVWSKAPPPRRAGTSA